MCVKYNIFDIMCVILNEDEEFNWFNGINVWLVDYVYLFIGVVYWDWEYF